ncbi:transglutaminase domain-containing protein [Streptomyces sp. NPDC007369]|uniref:transglutaminase domain-containing protein n=1 Tax=Streptomyces sp. NPDC007369 TaxID=3154589 RepID=UPI0033CDC234
MTSSLLRPRGRIRTGPGAGAADAGAVPVAGSTAPTPILDWEHPRVAALLADLAADLAAEADVEADVEADFEGAAVGPSRQIAGLRRAHRRISRSVRPVYSVQDERPVSHVLRLGRGSCSQRLAVLEAVARASGTATRVRGLVVDGSFWYPRFPRMRHLVPDQVLLAWPEFRLDDPAGRWLTVSELFGGLEQLSGAGGGGFTNAGPETLFEALSRTAIDWDGATTALCPAAATTGTAAGPAACDLSSHVLTDLGHFASRDELFTRHGQTLCTMARVLAEPVLGRHAAGA